MNVHAPRMLFIIKIANVRLDASISTVTGPFLAISAPIIRHIKNKVLRGICIVIRVPQPWQSGNVITRGPEEGTYQSLHSTFTLVAQLSPAHGTTWHGM